MQRHLWLFKTSLLTVPFHDDTTVKSLWARLYMEINDIDWNRPADLVQLVQPVPSVSLQS